MRFKELYEKELCQGSEANPITGVFDLSTEQGTKRWEDLKKRVVEHVCDTFELIYIMQLVASVKTFFFIYHIESWTVKNY